MEVEKVGLGLFYIKLSNYVKALSTILGMSLAKMGELSSRHGFVLTSISHGLK